MPDFPLVPEQASTIAGSYDVLFWTMTLISVAFAIPVAILVIFFAVRYRRGNTVDRSNIVYDSLPIELTWSIIPFVMGMGFFGWGAYVFYTYATPPADAMEIYVIGKQWMWHAQHATGKSEINDLHVPVNTPIKLIITSQDVIHSYYIPAFRVKQDAVPGRYTTLWFEATKVGTYHMFCAEYCGTEHSKMIGKIYVMEQAEYETWLMSGSNTAVASIATDGSADSLAAMGAQIFQQQACQSCHMEADGPLAPTLNGVYNASHEMADGSTVLADEEYLRTSILNPQADIVAGYGPPSVMPAYDGILSEQDVIALIDYIKSLADDAEAAAN